MIFIKEIARNFYFRELKRTANCITRKVVDIEIPLFSCLRDAYSQGSLSLNTYSWARFMIESAAVLAVPLVVHCILRRSDRSQNNQGIAMNALRQYRRTFEFENPEFQHNRGMLLARLKRNPLMLKSASDELRNDREMVLAAVSQNGYALEFASDELRNDREVVLAAVSQNGYALEFASPELRNNREVVLAAVSQNSYAFLFASDELQKDWEVALIAVRQARLALLFGDPNLKNALLNEIKAIKLLKLGLVTNGDSSLTRVRTNRLFDGNVLDIVQQFLIGDQVIQFGIGLKSKIASHTSSNCFPH